MRHRVIIKDYRFNEYTTGEGVGEILVNNVKLRVFLGCFKIQDRLYEIDYRGKEMKVDLRILEWDVFRVGIKKKMILYLDEENALVPHYLFIGEVKEKRERENDGVVVFDCGIQLEAKMEKGYSFNQLKKGDYILVIGRLDMCTVDDL